MKHWLMKTEPEEFSIVDLAARGTEPWSGVRNPMARNFMRAMAIGDAVLFYHSSCVPPGVAGLAKVCATSHVDASQFDDHSPYYDARSTPDKPRWDCVDVAYVSTFATYVPLEQIRSDAALSGMVLLRAGRLSVQPVSEAEYARIVELSTLPPFEPPPKQKRKPKPKLRQKPKRKPTPTARPKKPKPKRR
jgi:predicted RNA-binding protein with PUA-like domain